MMWNRKMLERYWRESILLVLLIANIFVWGALYVDSSEKTLKVYFLDVGQGDAIFFETPSGYQTLIDGGKNKKVVSELGKAMPFGDKSIDIVIATHPDADHIGGLPEVVSRYDIEFFLQPGVESNTSINIELLSRIRDKNIRTLLARRGQVINFGDGVRLIILFPSGDVSGLDPNDASIVARLDYGEQSFLLTGDAGIRTENILLNNSFKMVDIDVLKAGHHGSRTSTSLPFAEVASPMYAIISAGRGNTYGHPHKEVLDTLQKVDAKILSTIDMGTIKFETDGKTLKLK